MNEPHPAVVSICFFSDAFFAPTAFTGQQLTTGVSTPSRTATGVTMKIFDWKRRESQDGLGEMGAPLLLLLLYVPFFRLGHKVKRNPHTAGNAPGNALFFSAS